MTKVKFAGVGGGLQSGRVMKRSRRSRLDQAVWRGDASMAAGLTRRDLFRPRTGRTAIRPPWAVEEGAFVSRCRRCRDCAGACPEGIIAAGDGGFPQVSFGRGHCTFCGKCAEVCPSGALLRGEGRPWTAVAVIGGNCLSAAAVACRVCGEWCGEGAIRFRLATGGRAHPVVDADRCDGCGGCVRRCPVGAVTIASSEAEVAACA